MSAKPQHTYGAEALKRGNPRYTLVSLAVASLLLFGAFTYPKIVAYFEDEPEPEKLKVKASKVINFSQLSAPPPIDLEQPDPQTLKAPPKVKTVKFLKPVAKKDEEVPDDIELPTMNEMENTQIGTFDQDGVDSILVDVDYVVELPPDPEPEPVVEEAFAYVESMPTFKGGEEALLQYLADEIEYPAAALDASIEGIVYLQFVVEKDGSISGVQILRSVTKALDAEAIRVIRSMPAWIPGEQNGRVVRVKFAIPIRFQLRFD